MTKEAVSENVPEFNLSDRLRKSMRVAGIGVQPMADYLGVGRGSVSNWINGRIVIPKPEMRLWAMRTGVPLAWLRDGDPVTSRYTGDNRRNRAA